MEARPCFPFLCFGVRHPVLTGFGHFHSPEFLENFFMTWAQASLARLAALEFEVEVRHSAAL